MTPARKWLEMAAFEMYTTVAELYSKNADRDRRRLARRKQCIHLAWFFAKQKGLELERADVMVECRVCYTVAREAMRLLAGAERERVDS